MGRFRTYVFTELCGNVHAAVPLATGWHYLRDVSAPAVDGRGTRHMTPTSAIYLHIEKPRQSLAPTMAAMLTWLDAQKIELVGFIDAIAAMIGELERRLQELESRGPDAPK